MLTALAGGEEPLSQREIEDIETRLEFERIVAPYIGDALLNPREEAKLRHPSSHMSMKLPEGILPSINRVHGSEFRPD